MAREPSISGATPLIVASMLRALETQLGEPQGSLAFDPFSQGTGRVAPGPPVTLENISRAATAGATQGQAASAARQAAPAPQQAAQAPQQATSPGFFDANAMRTARGGALPSGIAFTGGFLAPRKRSEEILATALNITTFLKENPEIAEPLERFVEAIPGFIKGLFRGGAQRGGVAPVPPGQLRA